MGSPSRNHPKVRPPPLSGAAPPPSGKPAGPVPIEWPSMTETEVPDPDRVEDELERDEEGQKPLRRAAGKSEVPEADAQEQAQPLRRGSDERPSSRPEVPEADAQEQARAAWDEDDDDYR
jgi:hypothetical protein